MPLRFQSIIDDDNKNDLALAWALEIPSKEVDALFATKDNQHLLFCRNITNMLSSRVVGKMIVTTHHDEINKKIEIQDADFILNNDNRQPLQIDRKLDEADGIDCYEAIIPDTNKHLIIELVNYHVIEDETIEGKIHNVYLSAMPYRLSIFESYETYNKLFGFGSEGIKVARMEDYVVHGIAERFIAPTNVLTLSPDSENSSFVSGIIKSYEDVVIQLGDVTVSAYIVILDSPVGDLPTIVGKDVFDVANIAEGKIMGMLADIKADFAGNYYYRPTSDSFIR